MNRLLLMAILLGFTLDVLAQGSLFIIGGGKRPPMMMKKLVSESGLDKSGYGIILPQSSEEPDTSAFYAARSLTEGGAKSLTTFFFSSGDSLRSTQLDSLRKAALIFITGGDQNRFMSAVGGTPAEKAIMDCYQRGGMIAGTSAGAAVMSRIMITGRELRYPNADEDSFRTIEKDNIETARGLGLLKSTIIDQHFLKRKRMNRLVTAVLENPGQLGVGIDESTAILVRKNQATVIGESQVVLLRLNTKLFSDKRSLIGGRNIAMSVLVPGEIFPIE